MRSKNKNKETNMNTEIKAIIEALRGLSSGNLRHGYLLKKGSLMSLLKNLTYLKKNFFQ